jgi:hypothetical protein
MLIAQNNALKKIKRFIKNALTTDLFSGGKNTKISGSQHNYS